MQWAVPCCEAHSVLYHGPTRLRRQGLMFPLELDLLIAYLGMTFILNSISFDLLASATLQRLHSMYRYYTFTICDHATTLNHTAGPFFPTIREGQVQFIQRAFVVTLFKSIDVSSQTLFLLFITQCPILGKSLGQLMSLSALDHSVALAYPASIVIVVHVFLVFRRR